MKMSGVAYSTLGKMANRGKCEYVRCREVCLALGCRIEDVVEILPGWTGKN